MSISVDGSPSEVHGNAPKPSLTPQRLRLLHSAYNAGNRQPFVVDAERVYQRQKKRAQYDRLVVRRQIPALCGCITCLVAP